MDFVCPNCEELIKLSLRAAAANAKRKCPVCGTPIEQAEVLRQRKLDRQILEEQMEQRRLDQEDFEAQMLIDEKKRKRKEAVLFAFRAIYSAIKYSLLLSPFACCLWYWRGGEQTSGQDNPAQAQLNLRPIEPRNDIAVEAKTNALVNPAKPMAVIQPEPAKPPEMKQHATADSLSPVQVEDTKKVMKMILQANALADGMMEALKKQGDSSTLAEMDRWRDERYRMADKLKDIRADLGKMTQKLPKSQQKGYEEYLDFLDHRLDKLGEIKPFSGNPFAPQSLPQPAPEKSATETKKDMAAMQKETAEKATAAVAKTLADLEKTKEIYRTAKDGSPNKTLAKPAIDRLTESLRKSLGDPQLDGEMKKRIKDALAK